MSEHLNSEDLMVLCAYMDEGGDGKMCEQMLLHLQECPSCRALANTLMKTISLYRDTDREVVMSGDVRERLFDCLNLNDLA